MGLIRPVHQHTVVSLKGEQHFHRYCHLNMASANVKRQSHLFHTLGLLSYLTPVWQLKLNFRLVQICKRIILQHEAMAWCYIWHLAPKGFNTTLHSSHLTIKEEKEINNKYVSQHQRNTARPRLCMYTVSVWFKGSDLLRKGIF